MIRQLMQGGALKGLQDVIGDTDTGSGIAQGLFDMNTIGGVQTVEIEKRGDKGMVRGELPVSESETHANMGHEH